MFIVRAILRFIVILGDKLRPVSKVDLTTEQQEKIDRLAKGLILYHYPACPFCVKVARVMRAYNMDVDKRDPRVEPFKSELLKGGGEQKVPCLKIPGELDLWMYESDEIIHYLESEFDEILERGEH